MKLQRSINFKVNNFISILKPQTGACHRNAKSSIRILALIHRKPLIETKNCTLKCLKRHYSTVRSMKNVAVLTEDGAFALFFRPHPRGFDSSRVPTPRNLLDQGKKIANTRGQGVLGKAGIDCITMGYLNPALNNSALEMFSREYSGVKLKSLKVYSLYMYIFFIFFFQNRVFTEITQH